MPGLPCSDGQGGLWCLWQSQEATVALPYVQAQDYEGQTIRGETMTLEEAIETLRDLTEAIASPCGQKEIDALKLGIKALECVKEIRHHPFPDTVLQLPGETIKSDNNRG